MLRTNEQLNLDANQTLADSPSHLGIRLEQANQRVRAQLSCLTWHCREPILVPSPVSFSSALTAMQSRSES